MNEKVSIIVPVYNREKFLDKCIGSLVSQSYSDIEIMLVDDGSKDNSLSICKNWADEDRRIKVIHKENGGVQSARNLGIKNATGKYLTFVDADDYVSENYIQDFVRAKEENPNSKLVVCGHFRVDENYNILAKNDFLKDIYVGKTKEEHWALYFERFACYCWNHLYEIDIVKNNKIQFDKNIIVYDDTAFTMNYIRYIDDVSFTKSNNYYYVCAHSDPTVSKNLNKKRVADDGSLEKLKTCIDLHKRLLHDKFNFEKEENEKNKNWLSTVLTHISYVSLILYCATVQYDYRRSKEEINLLFDECYYTARNSKIDKWHYDVNELKTKLPSTKYVKIFAPIFSINKSIFKILCKIMGNEKLWQWRTTKRRNRIK